MKTILIYPASDIKTKTENNKFRNDVQDMEPLGLGYIGAICKSLGHETKMIHQLDETNEEILEKIREFQPEYLMISSLTFNYNNAVKIAEEVKKEYGNKIKIIIGGYHVSGSLLVEGETKLKRNLRDGTFDFVVNGEGEGTIKELLQYLEDGNENYSEIKGIAYFDKNNNTTIVNPKRKRLTNEEISELPLPLREGLPMERYKNLGFAFPSAEEQIFGTIYTQRGCSENCEFCCTPNVWNTGLEKSCGSEVSCNACTNEGCSSRKIRVTSRSVESIVEELEYLIREHGVNSVFFRDETFGVDKEHANKLLDAMIEKNIGDKIKWECFLRADSIVDENLEVDHEFLKKLKKAGCFNIPIGIEHPLFLKEINKKVTQEQIKKAFEAINQNGIKALALMMIGWPEETKESLDESLSFLKEIPFDRVRVSFVTPFEGTPLYDRVELTTKDYSEMSAEEPVIRCPELEKQLEGESYSEYLINFRQKMLNELYNTESYKERQREHIINAEKNWGKKWGPIWIRSHLAHFGFIKEHETHEFEYSELEVLAKEKIKEIEETPEQKNSFLGGTKIK